MRLLEALGLEHSFTNVRGEGCNGVTVYSPIYVNNKYVIYSCMQAYYIYNVRVGPSRHRPEEELTL